MLAFRPGWHTPVGWLALVLALSHLKDFRCSVPPQRFAGGGRLQRCAAPRCAAGAAVTAGQRAGRRRPRTRCGQQRGRGHFAVAASTAAAGTVDPGGHWHDGRQEGDALIQLIFDLMEARLTLEQACAEAERLIQEHLAGGCEATSALARVAPGLAIPSNRSHRMRRLHSALPLREAFRRYDAEARVSAREMVPPQFREVRNIVNLAQVLATARAGPRLVTFDGDGTLYPANQGLDCELQPGGQADVQAEGGARELVSLLLALLERGVAVALLTGVGDPRPEPYEARLAGPLKCLRGRALPPGAALYAVGGQCNYCFRYSSARERLEPLPREAWEPEVMKGWSRACVEEALDAAQAALEQGAARLGIAGHTSTIRKERAVGVLYRGKIHRSTTFLLDELALLARVAVVKVLAQRQQQLPFCTSNSGQDVFMDIGSKEIGVDLLRGLVGAKRNQTLHVGDKFSLTGNDLPARRACGTVWVDDPEETALVLRELLGAMG